MAEVKGIKETKELFEGLAVVAALIKEVSADGKVDFTDIAVVAKFQDKLPVLVAAVGNISEVGAEIKDLSLSEAIELITTVIDKIKAA